PCDAAALMRPSLQFAHNAVERFRQSALKWHPDRWPLSDGKIEAEVNFKRAQEAYDCLRQLHCAD
ncbi:hypothetical protein CYMTET_49643, partial [Cymbomonas tetramitiformis]